MSKQKQEIIPKAERVKRAQTKHGDQPIYNFNKYSDFLRYPKQVNTYYSIPATSMLKFDGTEPFELIQKIVPSINGKNIFTLSLVRYTG